MISKTTNRSVLRGALMFLADLILRKDNVYGLVLRIYFAKLKIDIQLFGQNQNTCVVYDI